MPESRDVADYYAQRREVPTNQIFGFDLPVTESMTRTEFSEQLQGPLLKSLEASGLFKLAGAMPSRASNAPGGLSSRVSEAKVRYALLCYGVPTKILSVSNLVERGAEQLKLELQRNEASVDSELACLPMLEENFRLSGPLSNPFYGATNAALLHPTNGILLVTRLDGPSAAIARGLVDKAMEAETNGLWGRAYFDTRGLTNGDYAAGDNLFRTAAQAVRRLGFETVIDDKPETFSAGFPMSHIGIYVGWYEWTACGPFARPTVDFMPGAVAYHLHSFNAEILRSATERWVGPLLAKGATVSLGSVFEPYLHGTPDIAVFLLRLIYLRFSLGEAFWAAQNTVSWQNLAVGDPLYRPFARRPDLLHADLERRQSKLVEWSHLRVVNGNLATGVPIDDALGYLESLPIRRQSALLTEKVADLYWAKKKLSDALDTYEQALKLNPSPEQKLRLLLTLAQRRSFYGPDSAAFGFYQQLLKEFPDYPEPLAIYQVLLPLAKRLDKKEVVEQCEREIQRLSPAR
jgi:uncharacterized protein (TIGR03790 family)